MQLLSDTLSGVSVNNTTTLSPTFNTATARDLYYLDATGTAISVETQLGLKADQSLLTSSYVSESSPSFSGPLNIGVNSMNIDRTILESLYTNYYLWKTAFPAVDLTPLCHQS